MFTCGDPMTANERDSGVDVVYRFFSQRGLVNEASSSTYMHTQCLPTYNISIIGAKSWKMYFLSVEHSELEGKYILIGCLCVHTWYYVSFFVEVHVAVYMLQWRRVYRSLCK